MNKDMIKQSSSQSLGRRGERWFVNQLPDNWIFQFPSEDIGIDGVVVIGEPGQLNGVEFRVQIKASRLWTHVHDKILLQVKRSAVRYWASGLTLTMLVLYEVDSGIGHYYWIPDLVDDPPSVFSGETHTITLRVPTTRPILPSCWSSVRDRLREHYETLSSAFVTASVAGSLLDIVHSLLESLRGLQFAQFAGLAHKDEERWLLSLLQATSHREVVNALNRILSLLHPDCGAARHIQSAVAAYRAEVETFLQPFDNVMASASQTAAVWQNPEKMNESRPRLISLITDVLLVLTKLTNENKGDSHALRAQTIGDCHELIEIWAKRTGS